MNNSVFWFLIGFLISQNIHCSKPTDAPTNDATNERGNCIEFQGVHRADQQTTYTTIFEPMTIHDPRLNFNFDLENGSVTVTSDTLIFCLGNLGKPELYVLCSQSNHEDCHGLKAKFLNISNDDTVLEWTIDEEWINCFAECQNFGFNLNYKEQ
jgi:hypothetical protein